MEGHDRWMQIEAQLVQLTGEVRDRRARVRRLHDALDETRDELARVQEDLHRLRRLVPSVHARPGAGDAAISAIVEAQAQQVAAIEATAEQLRQLVALHRVFRDLARLIREVTGNHELRLRGLEGLLAELPRAVH